MSDTPPNPLEGLLSDFALGPAWARGKSDSTKPKFKDGGEREYKPRGRDAGGGRDDRNQRGGRRDDRRQGGGNRRDFNKGDRSRSDFRREEIPPAQGVGVILLPKKEAIQLVCKEIHQVARVYPLYDIAEIILAERSRSHAVFEISKKKDPFYQSKFDDAVFLTKEEALQHLLQSDWRGKFIEESTVEVDPPKGNFQSVAKCGISGEWLGPPNYHGYQTEIRRLHRERFAHMPFESYLAKVRTERSEEAVNEWLDSMKSQTRWRILSDKEIATVAKEDKDGGPQPSDSDAPPSESVPEEPATAEPAAEAPLSEEPVAAESAPETATEATAPVEEPEAVEESSETPEPAEPTALEPATEADTPADDVKWFTDRAEAERAIAAEVLDKAFKRTHKAKVSAEIPGKNLSPGLLVRLKGTGSHHRKHPAIVIPAVCKVLEAEHMPVFKRKGKLYTGPARPHALAADAVLAPRPGEMVKWIRENSPAKLEGLWKAVLPEGATAPPAEYAADLFWLLQQGHILLYTDDTLVVQELPKPQQPKKPKAPKEKKEKAAKDSASQPAGSDTASPEGSAPEPRDPIEIIKDAVEETAEVISQAASELIDAAVASVAPEVPAPSEPPPKSETPSKEPEPEKPTSETEDSAKPSSPEN